MEITDLLKLLNTHQTQLPPGFQPGMVYSARCLPILLYHRPDNSLFFSLSIAAILKHSLPLMRDDEKPLALAFIDRTISLLPLFRNKDGLGSYNFWKTGPSRHFPFGRFAHRFRFFQIPDDIDDSALAHYLHPHLPEDTQSLITRLAAYANGQRNKWIVNTLPEFRKLPAYNTFFVKDMASGFDFCALCNLMVWRYNHPKDWGLHDEASETYLQQIIAKRYYLTHSFEVAPYYPKTSLILYHAARLWHLCQPQWMKPYLQQLIRDADEQLPRASSITERKLLCTALIRLGGKPAEADENMSSEAPFYFFVAGTFTEFENPLLRWLASKSITQIKYRCEAFNTAIALEYQLCLRAG
jgi:hypothetical protein